VHAWKTAMWFGWPEIPRESNVISWVSHGVGRGGTASMESLCSITSDSISGRDHSEVMLSCNSLISAVVQVQRTNDPGLCCLGCRRRLNCLSTRARVWRLSRRRFLVSGQFSKAVPFDRHSTERELLFSGRMRVINVGPKNMTSSSGCAITSNRFLFVSAGDCILVARNLNSIQRNTVEYTRHRETVK
jgi:hypothetical protein